MLVLSKLESGKTTFAAKPFRLKTIIEEVAQIFAAPLELKKLPLILSLPEADPWIKGDANRLKMVLINLVANALKFTKQGHIKMNLHMLDITPTHTSFILRVEDTGIGMTPEEVDQLFQRFSRAAAAEYEGSGLGLFISKRFIESMGGQIEVKSQKGRGSEFIIQLTCESAEAEKALPPLTTQALQAASLASLPTTSKRILVVEDNLVNQRILRKLLENANYNCEVANNGQEAFNKWTTSPFDLIFMDIEMPVMGGLEATQAIREREQRSALSTRIPIVGLSAYASSEFIAKAREAGMNDYITKPYKKVKIYNILERLTASPLETFSSQQSTSSTLLAKVNPDGSMSSDDNSDRFHQVV